MQPAHTLLSPRLHWERCLLLRGAHYLEARARCRNVSNPFDADVAFNAGPHVQGRAACPMQGRTSNAGLYAQRRAFRSLQGRTFNAGHTILIIAPMIGNAYCFRKCAVFSKDCLHATIGKFSGVPKSEMMTILLEARRQTPMCTPRTGFAPES